MAACSHFRLLGILLLFGMMVPAGLAADPLWTVRASPDKELSVVTISQDGSTIVAGGDQLIAIAPDGTKLWSAWSGTALDISRDGKYIVTSQGNTVRLLSRTGTMLWDQPMGGTVTAVSISPDAALIAAGGGSTVQAWHNSGSGLGKNTTGTVRDLRISPEKDQIVVTTTTELRGFNLSYVPNWYDDTISPGSVEVSGDGTGIVIPYNNRVRMYHGSGTLLWEKAFLGGNILSLAYARDGSTIVAGRDDGSVLVLDRKGDLLWTKKTGSWIMSVGVSDNGSTIATGSLDNQINVYDRQGTLLGKGKTKNPIKSRSVAVSGDGSLIVAVDISDVYCFSRTRLTVPAGGPVPENAGNVSAATTTKTMTPATPVPDAGKESLPSRNTTVTVTGTTPSSGFPWFLALVSLALITAAQKMKRDPDVPVRKVPEKTML